MVLAFGGIFVLLAVIALAIVVGWALLSYTRGTVEAAEDGLEDGIDDAPPREQHDAGHVAGPQGS
jgi:hypothetical protein